jgi:hypothetical protein
MSRSSGKRNRFFIARQDRHSPDGSSAVVGYSTVTVLARFLG